MKILMIVPAYNEEENIKSTVSTIINYKKRKLDYIIINDGSKDDTKKVLENNKFNYINLVNNSGIGTAVQTGYKYAKNNNYDIAIQFDGDGQHDINYVDRLIYEIEKNQCDMVIGSRFVGNESSFKSTKSRRVGIHMLSFVLYILTGQRIKDMTSGYRAVNKKIIEEFSKDYDFEYPEPITNLKMIKKKYIVKEIPVGMKERQYGKSSINFYKSIYYMINVFITMFIFGVGRRK